SSMVGMAGAAAHGQAAGLPASRLASAPRLPWQHTPALQPGRQAACEDSDVQRRGHRWPRREARPLLSPWVFAWGGIREGYMLWVVSTMGRGAYGGWALPPHVGRPAGGARGHDAGRASPGLACGAPGQKKWWPTPNTRPSGRDRKRGTAVRSVRLHMEARWARARCLGV